MYILLLSIVKVSRTVAIATAYPLPTSLAEIFAAIFKFKQGRKSFDV